MDSLKGTLTPMKVLNGTLNGGIAYGTFNYNELENKPSVNGHELVGNVNIPIPTKTSDLTNDSGFITSANVPTKTSDLTNDSGFITAADIPTKTSELTNDSGFITSEDIPEMPTKTSQLNNDSGFLTINTTPVKSVNSQTGDVNLFIPNATSQLTNDSGFLTMNTTPVRSVNSQTGDVNLFIPNATSQLTNDSGFITSEDIPSPVKLNTIEDVAIASFSDGADNVPVSELIVDIEARQEGSGTPSPDNVREILGFDSGVIASCGVNLWDEEWESGIWTTDGTKGTDNTAIRSKNYIAVAPNSRIYLVLPFRIIIRELDINKNFIRTVTPSASQAFISSPTAKYIVFCTYSADNITTYSDNISFNYPATDTQYHPYNGNTYTVNFGQTVYGGSLNVTTGELTITHGYIASYNGETINEPWISSIDEYAPNTSPSTGAEVVYPLSAPNTTTLTPTEVRTLLNNNNIFVDTGNINRLVYFKTGCENIAKLIEAYMS